MKFIKETELHGDAAKHTLHFVVEATGPQKWLVSMARKLNP